MAIPHSCSTQKEWKNQNVLTSYGDYKKLNATTEANPCPLPFCDTILDSIVGHEIYTFLDGFSGYTQVLMAPKDRDKIAFITKWGAFASNDMNFGLKNAPPTFQKWIQEAFRPFLTLFMRVFLDEFSVIWKNKTSSIPSQTLFQK